MKKILTITIGFLISLSTLFAQEGTDLNQKKKAISRLEILKGHWEGSGWASSPDGTRNEFDQQEVVEGKLNGLALLVEGLGKRKDTDEVIHDALAIITYNTVDSSYIFQSHLDTGQSTSAKGYFEMENFIWGFEVPGGQVKYTINITDNSEWKEIGEFSRDGNQWYQFFEMNLEKVSDN